MKDDLMLIGELAEFFGISRKAIRLYEKKGIIKPAQVDEQTGYRYYAAEQVQQLNALLELKSLGFSLNELKTVMDGQTSVELLRNAMIQKQHAWQEAMESAKYKMECLENIINNLQASHSTKKISEMTEEERAWFLVKMVCIEDIRAQKALSEALWL